MLSRIPRAQRRMFFLSLGALVLAIAFVVFAVIFATGREAVRPGEYQPFEVGNAAALSEAIVTQRPIFFADPVGGDRGFVLAVVDGDIAALHVVPPGNSSACPVDWAATEKRFEDCTGRVWPPRSLARFPTEIDEDEILVVDLRTRQEPTAEPG